MFMSSYSLIENDSAKLFEVKIWLAKEIDMKDPEKAINTLGFKSSEIGRT